jgi:hypothetical protein
MSGRRFVLLHSPLLGPFSLNAAAAELTALGARADAPSWPKLSAISGAYYATLARGMASTIDVAGREPVVLVAHSGAGALVPALAAELMAPLEGVIFLDSVLPHPGRSWLDAAPAGTREQLTAGAQMGQLPPWDDWWPPGALAKLLPDAALRDALVAELEPLPLAYFEEPAPSGDVSALGAAGYLQLSDSYADEARAAGRLGWPTVSLPLHHLGPLSHPKPVASILMSLASRLVESGRG